MVWIYKSFGIMVRVFTNGSETWVQSQVESYQRHKKWYLRLPCLIQHYEVKIKGKWSNPRKGVAPSLLLGVVAIEKGAFCSLSITVANFTLLVKISILRRALEFLQDCDSRHFSHPSRLVSSVYWKLSL